MAPEPGSLTALTVATQYIEANGVRFAYRRFGTSEVPLVFHNAFRHNMDWWDPALIDGIAQKRQVILFDNRGVGRTYGTVPDNFQDWANDLISFVQALGLDQVDLFGFSMGGRVVQTVAITQPSFVRKMIVAGGSAVQPMPNSPKDTRDTKYMMGMATAETNEESKEAFKLALFGESREGAAAFEKYWQRLQQRTVEPPLLDALPLEEGARDQIAAVLNADKPENVRTIDPLGALTMPVLIANGNNDLTLGQVRTFDFYGRLPNAQLMLYPNSGHGFLWQYAGLFAEHINLFLDSAAFDAA